MITVLTGENSFALREALASIVADFSGTPERYEGSSLTLPQLPDIFMGATLFASQRLVIVSGLSENSSLWTSLVDWLDKANDDTQVVLIEEKLDKRTTTYKALKAKTDIHEFPLWTDRDRSVAERWVKERAAKEGLTLDTRLAAYLVHRVGLDQWSLASAIEKLILLDTVTQQTIDEHIDASPLANIFQLFELALQGDRAAVHDTIKTLELTDDPYATFALLSSQAFQTAALTLARPEDSPTKDFAIHPFVASKLERYGNRLGPQGAKRLISSFAQADADMKISKAEPWLLIEKTLLDIAK